MTPDSHEPENVRDDWKVASRSAPTLAEVYDRLREEYEVLGLLSYHGAPWDLGATTWYADLTKDDVDKLRGLLRDAGAAIEGYAMNGRIVGARIEADRV